MFILVAYRILFQRDFCPFYKPISLKNFKDYMSHVFIHLKNRFSKMINIIDIGQELHNLQDLIKKNLKWQNFASSTAQNKIQSCIFAGFLQLQYPTYSVSSKDDKSFQEILGWKDGRDGIWNWNFHHSAFKHLFLLEPLLVWHTKTSPVNKAQNSFLKHLFPLNMICNRFWEEKKQGASFKG